MGANASSLLSEEIEEIARESKLSARDIKRLYKRFQKLDRSKCGTLSTDDLTMIPELAMNPLVPRITALLHNANFRQFVNFLSVFGPNASAEEKLDFSFRIYDVDGDGVISGEDLRTVLKMMVGSNLNDSTLNEITESILASAELQDGNAIDRPCFEKAMNSNDLMQIMTLSSLQPTAQVDQHTL